MSGVPVVGARIGGIAEIVDDGVTGVLYESRSPDALSHALRGLIENRERLAAMSRAIGPVKTMETHAREWEAIYGELRARVGQ